MKKTIIILSLLVSAAFTFGQSQRMVLAEEFTNASCGPCASQNPAFDALLNNNADIATSIKYHTSWPGTDPMYSHNTVHSVARVSYYNVSGVPYALIDSEPKSGSSYFGAPANVNQASITAAAAIPSPFEVQVQQELSADEQTILLTAMIKATDVAIGNLKLHMAVIEKHIHYNNAPGGNGEKDFYNVMKSMVPTANGTDLPQMEVDDYIIIEGGWDLAHVYDNSELAAVCFIQNDATKDVHQAANSTIEPLTPYFNTDAEVYAITNIDEANCSGIISPKVVIRNNGADALTSTTIQYSINGGDVQTFEWTGSLNFLEKETIQLPELSFDIEPENTFTAVAEMPNGITDEYIKNNTNTFVFQKAFVTSDVATLTMRLDANPEETSWEITNSSGEVTFSGGDYTTPNQFINDDFEFDVEDCYTFTIYDSEGDGFGTGGFMSFHIGDDIIVQGTDFGAEASNVFEYATFISIPENETILAINLFPNPATDQLNIAFDIRTAKNVTFEIMDISGKLVKEIDAGMQNQGTISQSIELSGLERGLYILKTIVGEKTSVNKFSKN
jgi:Secretion system C-terminal sorting domain/Outer membrane protein Omp28